MADASFGLALQPDASRLTLPRFLEDVALRHGSRAALRLEGRDTTYTQLRGEARSVARGLIAAGVARGEHVALLVANRPEFAFAAFGAALAGAVIVPISTFATPEERAYQLEHSDAVFLLHQRALLGRDFAAELAAAARPPRLRCVQRWGDAAVSLGADARLDAEIEARSAAISPSDPGMLIYTSGTTARPKAVMHRQQAPVIQSWRFAELMDLTPEDRVFSAQPFFWTAGIAMSLGATLAAGARLILQETFEPGAALALIERERATTLHAWPHQEKAMAEHPSAAQRDLSRVRKLEFSNPLAKLVPLTRDEWGTYGCYGTTETFTLATAWPARAPAERRHASHGPPLPGNEVRIVDASSGAPLGGGEHGEIALRGPTLMLEYWKTPRAECFDAEGFYRTGDAGWIDAEGNLHWRGRLTSLIKTGGANVSPLEVEEELAAYPGVQSAHALGVPHATLGEVLVLCVVTTESARACDCDTNALRDFLRPRLAAYKQPRAVLVFDARDVALTGSQKVATTQLRERVMQRLAAASVEIAGHRY